MPTTYTETLDAWNARIVAEMKRCDYEVTDLERIIIRTEASMAALNKRIVDSRPEGYDGDWPTIHFSRQGSQYLGSRDGAELMSWCEGGRMIVAEVISDVEGTRSYWQVRGGRNCLTDYGWVRLPMRYARIGQYHPDLGMILKVDRRY